MKHFSDCPINRGYDVCTCDMAGEESCIIEWAIMREEGRLKWYHFTARWTLAHFGPPAILKIK